MNIVGFLAGHVRFEAQGGSPERLLSLAAERGIPLWNTSRQGVSLFAHCPAVCYRELRPLVHRCGMRMRIQRRYGLPFLLRPLRCRWGLAVGAVIAVVLLQVLSSRVWSITVIGNQRVETAAILQALESLGVRQGATFSHVDIPEVQLTALQKLPELSWLAVSQEGSTVTVAVREKQESQPVEETAPANVVAACDGVIVNIEVTGGQAAVQVGDAVTTGTLLISGVTDSNVGPLLRRASGSVTARTTLTIKAEALLQDTVEHVGQEITRPTLVLFGWHIPLYTASKLEGEYTERISEYPLRAYGKPLPVGLRVARYYYPKQQTVTRTIQQAEALALTRLAELEREALAGAAVESRHVRQEEQDDRVVVTGDYVLVREIGKTEIISTKGH